MAAATRRAVAAAVLIGFLPAARAAPLTPPADPALNAVGAFLDRGDYAGAEAAARAELTRLESAAAADSVDLAYVLDCLVTAIWSGGRLRDDELDALALRALAVREAVHGRDSFRTYNALLNLGAIAWKGGDLDGAQRWFERSARLLEAGLGPDDINVGTVLNNLALVQWSQGDLPGAIARLEQAIAIFETKLGDAHPFVPQALGNLGIVLTDTGDLARADTTLERAVALGRDVLGPEHPEFVRALNARARVRSRLGDYPAAIALFEEAIAVRERVLSPDHPDLAWSLVGLANVLRDAGDYVRAQPLFERAIRVRETALGPDHPDLAGDLAGLAELHERRDAPEEAVPLYERAISIYAAAGVDGIAPARAWAELGAALAAAGEGDRALDAARRSLGLWASVGDHPDEAIARADLASLLLADGRPAEAVSELERACDLTSSSLGPHHPRLAVFRALLAGAVLAGGDRSRALDLALGAEEISREHVRSVSRRFEERRALAYNGARVDGLDLSLTIAATGCDPGGVARVLDAVVRSRALVLDEMTGRQRARSGAANAAGSTAWDELARARTVLSNVLVRGPGDDLEEYREVLSLAEARKERAERALAERNEGRERDPSSDVGLADVLAGVGAEEAVVSFVRYERAPDNRAMYLALVARPGDGVRAFDLGGASELEARVARWRDEASRGELDLSRSSRRSEEVYREAGAALRRAIWDPLEESLRGATRVFVVLDGPLHLVSLDTLPDDGGGYLVERNQRVHLLTAERDLAVSSSRPPVVGDPQLLAIGGVAYDGQSGAAATAFRGATSPCASFRALRFGPLPASRREADEVAAIWKDGSPGETVLELVADAATEGAFKTNAPGKRVLHLATHGFFLGEGCARGESGPEAETGRITSGNPLLLSGLAMAGANLRDAADPEREDGIVTAEEIAALDLEGVEWAVLSACDTGLGTIVPGEGVLGLRRAFLQAGARSVIMTIWPVEDDTARRLMLALYEGRAVAGGDAAAATRAASLAVLRELRAAGASTHPFHWGAFLAVGKP